MPKPATASVAIIGPELIAPSLWIGAPHHIATNHLPRNFARCYINSQHDLIGVA
jgi:hypothetical protein